MRPLLTTPQIPRTGVVGQGLSRPGQVLPRRPVCGLDPRGRKGRRGRAGTPLCPLPIPQLAPILTPEEPQARSGLSVGLPSQDPHKRAAALLPAARLTWTAPTSPSCRRTCCRRNHALRGPPHLRAPPPPPAQVSRPGLYPPPAPRRALICRWERPRGVGSQIAAQVPAPAPAPGHRAARTARRTPGRRGAGPRAAQGEGGRLPAQNQSDQLGAGRLLAQVSRPRVPGWGRDPQIGVRLSSLPGTFLARETRGRYRNLGWRAHS